MALLARSFMCLACMDIGHSTGYLPRGWMHLGWAERNQLVVCEKCKNRYWDESDGGLEMLKWASEQWAKMTAEIKDAAPPRRIVLRPDLEES